MTPERETLSTADLARASDDVRGRSDEQVRARDNVAQAAKRDAAVGAQRLDEMRQTLDVQAPTPSNQTPQRAPDEERTALFGDNDAADLRKRWVDVQTGFVDEPRKAVEQADSLVAEVMKSLAEMFANERAALERQWDRGDNVTTEDLRVALRRYRTFFDRLLSI
jgi:hypothetical protein